MATKECPWCCEKIDDAAIKCKWCKSLVNEEMEESTNHNTTTSKPSSVDNVMNRNRGCADLIIFPPLLLILWLLVAWVINHYFG